MSVMGSMLKPKKTEITDKLRQEINKVREQACWQEAGTEYRLLQPLRHVPWTVHLWAPRS